MTARHEVFTVDSAPRLDLRIPAGEVSVRTGVDDEVRVTIEASDVDEVVVGQLGGTVTVTQESRWRFRSRSVRVLAEVPAGCDVEMSTVSAAVHLTGQLGSVRLKTVSGDVSVDRAERLEISTTSGSCRVGDIGADTRLNAVSGDYAGQRVGGRLQASTASGDIRVVRADGDVQVATTSGDIRIDRCHGDDITAKSVSGDVTVGLPTGIRVDADLSTISGRTLLPEPRPDGSDSPRRQVRLRLRSVSGDLRIERVDLDRE